jgi:hypothetical protein
MMDPATGMIIASLISGLGGAAASIFQKRPKVGSKQVPLYSPEQQKLQRMITDNLSPELIQELYGPINEGQLRERFERRTGDPARQQFREELIPELQEMFSGIGSKGGDAEQYQLASAYRRLDEDLARQYEDVYDRELNARRTGVQNVMSAQPVATLPTYNQPSNPVGAFATSFAGNYADNFSKWLSNSTWNAMRDQNMTNPNRYQYSNVQRSPLPGFQY